MLITISGHRYILCDGFTILPLITTRSQLKTCGYKLWKTPLRFLLCIFCYLSPRALAASVIRHVQLITTPLTNKEDNEMLSLDCWERGKSGCPCCPRVSKRECSAGPQGERAALLSSSPHSHCDPAPFWQFWTQKSSSFQSCYLFSEVLTPNC